jgi:hypothetical protein
LLRIFLRGYQEYREEGLHYRAVEELYENYISYRNQYTVIPFHQLLRNFGGIFQATDKRDHVFALLELKAEFKIDIEPNYEVDPSAVHITAAKVIVKGSESLNMFQTFSQDPPITRKTFGLPSWVPNWHNEPEHAPLYIPQYREISLRSPDAYAGRRHVWVDNDEPDCLIVRGKVIDSLSGQRTSTFERTTLDRRQEDLHRYLDLHGNLEILQLEWAADSGQAPNPVRLLRATLADSARKNDVPIEAARFPGINLRDFDALLETY